MFFKTKYDNFFRSNEMATKRDVLDGILKVKSDIAAQIDTLTTNLNTQIASLKTELANGVVVTTTDLDEILLAIKQISVTVPVAPVVVPVGTV